MQYSFVLPYLRNSPIHLPRRDLVLSSADSLLLTVAVVESDNPSAQALVLSTTANGPAMQLVIWDDTAWSANGRWGRADYGYAGACTTTTGTMLQSISGVPGSALGSWDFYLPTGTFSQFPLRCGWAILLLWNDGARSSVLGQGTAHFLRPFFTGVPLEALLPPVYPIIPPGAPSLLGLITSNGLLPIMTSTTALRLETS